MCVAWGQEHYRTFDNNVYTFTGQCTYVLARDCAHNTFTVNVINDRNCRPGGDCKRELDLYLGSSKVWLFHLHNWEFAVYDSSVYVCKSIFIPVNYIKKYMRARKRTCKQSNE